MKYSGPNRLNEYEDLSKIKSIYYLYLSGLFTFYISTLIGYCMAFGERKNRNNSIIMDSHYEYIVKILNMNILFNMLLLLTCLAYVFYNISMLDFMNMEIELLVEKVSVLVSTFSIFSIIITVIFYVQILKGLKKANGQQQI
jgi:uncharacterized membrane protein